MVRTLLRYSILPCLLLVSACSQPSETVTCEQDCFSPPPAVCSGDVLTTFSLLGSCEEGSCVYPPITTDCAAEGGTCEDARCVLPADPCDDVTCDEPPATACEGNTLVSWDGGTCNSDDGSCVYDRTEVDCVARSQVCQGDRCIAPTDPCIDVVCDAEPDDTCEGDVAVRFNDTGTCSDGVCTYSERARVDCAAQDGTCVDGRCTPRDPCEDVVCTTPPVATCDGTVASGYEVPGTCVDGTCRYLETVEDCADSDLVCVDGACEQPDPCVGVRCTLPPAARCEGTNAIVYASPGTCDGGTCTYPSTTTDCSATGQRCQRGSCLADAGTCDGVTCTTPPPARCEGATLIEYITPGTCESGACEYATSTQDCAASGGTCQPEGCVLVDPLCEDVLCGPTPENECDDDGQILTEYTGGNSCVGGLCVAPSVEVDCAALGLVCRDGACAPRDTCAGVVCRRTDRCEGGIAVSYAGDGSCSEGVCNFDSVEVRTDCGTLGLGCYDGACQRAIDTLVYGDLVISEIMPAPASANPLDAWFELENRTGRDLDLRGLIIAGDEAGVQRIEVDSTFVVPAGGFAVFSASWPGPNPGAPTWVFEPDDFALAEDGDVLLLGADGALGALYFDVGFSYSRGVSAEYDASQTELGAYTDPRSWCAARRIDARAEVSTAGRRGDSCRAGITPGALVVSEVLRNGTGSRPEDAYQWIELYNASGAAIALAGVAIETGPDDWATLPRDVVVGDGDFVSIALRGATAAQFDTSLPLLSIPDGATTLTVTLGGSAIDSVAMAAAFATTPSRASGLRGPPYTAEANDVPGAWCDQSGGAGVVGVGFGTPGAPNACIE